MGKLDLEAYLSRQLASRVGGVRVEVEQKFRVQDIERIRKLLRRLGARLTKSGYEHNELFDMDGRLKEKEYKLRLRRHGPKRAWLTLKGPRQEGDSKQRMEVETPVDYESTKHILELLDYRVCDTYAKQREEYALDACAVSLDYLEGCGWFVEIEGKTGTQIKAVARRLGLKEQDREHRSYRRLFKAQAVA
jgi:adenylate cyclase class 2